MRRQRRALPSEFKAKVALARTRPEIFNSDQGAQFTNPRFLQRLESAQVRISMDGKGRFLDNIFVERLWRTVKYEAVYLNDSSTSRRSTSRNLISSSA